MVRKEIMCSHKVTSIELSIILPAYNEEGQIERAIHQNFQTIEELDISAELVVINDGSSDRTLEILENLKRQYPQMTLLNHGKNKGFGGAIHTGVQKSQGKFCIVAPADNPTTLFMLNPFLKKRNESDLIIGYRSQKPGYNSVMIRNSKIYHLIMRIFCNLHYKDLNWIHVYRRTLFNYTQIEFKGILIGAEMILKAQTLGCRINEVPCSMEERTHGVASASRPKIWVKTFFEMVKFLYKAKFGLLKLERTDIFKNQNEDREKLAS